MSTFIASKEFAQYMMNRKSYLLIWVPMISFYFLYRLFGLVPAIVITGIYGIAIDFIYREESNLFIYAIVLFGVLELVIFTLVPKKFIFDVYAYRVALVAIKKTMIFTIFSMINKPLIQVMAERFRPKLLEWNFRGDPFYKRVWHEISFLWILVYAAKTLYFIIMKDSLTEDRLVLSAVIAGWPLFGVMMYLSFWWPHWRWAKIETG